MNKRQIFRKTISAFLVVTFGLSMVVTPSQAQLLANLPAPGQMVGLTAGFQPPVLRGMTVHPENPLLFDFIVDRGQDQINNDLLKVESTKLIKYFLASMTIPDKDAWVNLSPYEKDRIIPDALGQTEMGRQMLEQDYMLKQLSSSLTNPDQELGQKFWNEVKARAQKQFGTTEIPLNTFNKVWIMPDGATVVEKNGFAYITESKLKVLLAEDYEKSLTQDKVSELSTAVFREMILPKLVEEVNTGKTFAQTRQVYQSVILAAWYKKALKDSLLGRIYADQSKIEGVESDVKDIKQKVYDQYLEAFKKGVYNVIKEDYATEENIPRKYFSGGEIMAASSSLTVIRDARSVKAILTAIQKLGNRLALVAANTIETKWGAQYLTEQAALRWDGMSVPFDFQKAFLKAVEEQVGVLIAFKNRVPSIVWEIDSPSHVQKLNAAVEALKNNQREKVIDIIYEAFIQRVNDKESKTLDSLIIRQTIDTFLNNVEEYATPKEERSAGGRQIKYHRPKTYETSIPDLTKIIDDFIAKELVRDVSLGSSQEITVDPISGGSDRTRVFLIGWGEHKYIIKLNRKLFDPVSLTLKNQAEILTRLNKEGGNVHIAKIILYGQGRYEDYLVMNYLPGQSLADFIRADGPLPLMERIKVAVGLSQATKFAHDNDVIVRDIVSRNIQIGPNGTVSLYDFDVSASKGYDWEKDEYEINKLDAPKYDFNELGDRVAAQTWDVQQDIADIGGILLSMAGLGLPENVSSLDNSKIGNGELLRIIKRTIASRSDSSDKGRYQSVDELLADLENLQSTLETLQSAASSALIVTSSGKTMAKILSTAKFASPAKAKGRLLWLVKPYPKNKKLETEYANMSDDQLAAQLIGFIESGFLYQQVFLDHKEDLRAAGLRGFLNLLAVEDYKSEYYNFINDVVNDFIGNLLGKEPGSTGWLGSTEAERKEFYKAKAALKTLFERSGVNTQVLLNMTFAIDRSPGMIEIEVGDIIYSELSAKPSDTNSAFAIMTRLLNIMQTPQSPVSKSDLSSLYSNPTLQKDKIDQTLRELEIVEDETNRDLYKLSPALQAVLAPHIQSIQTIIAQDNDTNRKMGLASSALEFKTELARSLVATIRMKGPEAIAQFEAFYTLYTQGLFKENPDVVLTAITRTPTTIRITLQRNFLALRQAQADTASGEFKEVLQIATEILSQPNPSRNKLTESGRSYLNLIGAANMFDGLFPQIEEIFDNQFKSTAIIFRLNEVGKNTFTVLPIASNEMSFVREVTDQSEAQNTLLHDATMKYLGIIRGILKNNRTGEEFEGYAFVDGDRGHIGNWDRFIKQLVDRNIVTVASSASTPVGDSTESLFTELQILRDRMLPEALGDGYSPERLALQESRRATARLLNNPLDPGYEAALQTISKSGENNSFPVEVLRRSHYDDTINVIWVPREDYDQFNPSKSPAFFNREFAFSPVGGKLLLAIHEHRHSEAELLHPGIESEIDAYMGSLAELIELAGLGLRQAQEEVTNLAQPQNQYEQDLAAQYSGDINRQAIVIYAARVRVYLMGPSYRLLRKNMSRDLSTMDRDGIFNIMTIVTEMMLRDPMNYKKEEIRKQLTFLINRGYKEFFGFLGKYAEYFGPELKLLRWDDEHPFYERFRRIVLSRATTSSGSSNGSAVSSGVITSISTSVPITANPGGIDFDPSKLNLQIKRDGRGVPLPLPQQNLETIDIKGLYPVIINIQPINAQTLPILSQIDNPEPTVLSKS